MKTGSITLQPCTFQNGNTISIAILGNTNNVFNLTVSTAATGNAIHKNSLRCILTMKHTSVPTNKNIAAGQQYLDSLAQIGSINYYSFAGPVNASQDVVVDIASILGMLFLD